MAAAVAPAMGGVGESPSSSSAAPAGGPSRARAFSTPKRGHASSSNTTSSRSVIDRLLNNPIPPSSSAASNGLSRSSGPSTARPHYQQQHSHRRTRSDMAATEVLTSSSANANNASFGESRNSSSSSLLLSQPVQQRRQQPRRTLSKQPPSATYRPGAAYRHARTTSSSSTSAANYAPVAYHGGIGESPISRSRQGSASSASTSTAQGGGGSLFAFSSQHRASTSSATRETLAAHGHHQHGISASSPKQHGGMPSIRGYTTLPTQQQSTQQPSNRPRTPLLDPFQRKAGLSIEVPRLLDLGKNVKSVGGDRLGESEQASSYVASLGMAPLVTRPPEGGEAIYIPGGRTPDMPTSANSEPLMRDLHSEGLPPVVHSHPSHHRQRSGQSVSARPTYARNRSSSVDSYLFPDHEAAHGQRSKVAVDTRRSSKSRRRSFVKHRSRQNSASTRATAYGSASGGEEHHPYKLGSRFVRYDSRVSGSSPSGPSTPATAYASRQRSGSFGGVDAMHAAAALDNRIAAVASSRRDAGTETEGEMTEAENTSSPYSTRQKRNRSRSRLRNAAAFLTASSSSEKGSEQGRAYNKLVSARLPATYQSHHRHARLPSQPLGITWVCGARTAARHPSFYEEFDYSSYPYGKRKNSISNRLNTGDPASNAIPTPVQYESEPESVVQRSVRRQSMHERTEPGGLGLWDDQEPPRDSTTHVGLPGPSGGIHAVAASNQQPSLGQKGDNRALRRRSQSLINLQQSATDEARSRLFISAPLMEAQTSNHDFEKTPRMAPLPDMDIVGPPGSAFIRQEGFFSSPTADFGDLDLSRERRNSLIAALPRSARTSPIPVEGAVMYPTGRVLSTTVVPEEAETLRAALRRERDERESRLQSGARSPPPEDLIQYEASRIIIGEEDLPSMSTNERYPVVFGRAFTTGEIAQSQEGEIVDGLTSDLHHTPEDESPFGTRSAYLSAAHPSGSTPAREKGTSGPPATQPPSKPLPPIPPEQQREPEDHHPFSAAAIEQQQQRWSDVPSEFVARGITESPGLAPSASSGSNDAWRNTMSRSSSNSVNKYESYFPDFIHRTQSGGSEARELDAESRDDRRETLNSESVYPESRTAGVVMVRSSHDTMDATTAWLGLGADEGGELTVHPFAAQPETSGRRLRSSGQQQHAKVDSQQIDPGHRPSVAHDSFRPPAATTTEQYLFPQQQQQRMERGASVDSSGDESAFYTTAGSVNASSSVLDITSGAGRHLEDRSLSPADVVLGPSLTVAPAMQHQHSFTSARSYLTSTSGGRTIQAGISPATERDLAFYTAATERPNPMSESVVRRTPPQQDLPRTPTASMSEGTGTRSASVADKSVDESSNIRRKRVESTGESRDSFIEFDGEHPLASSAQLPEHGGKYRKEVEDDGRRSVSSFLDDEDSEDEAGPYQPQRGQEPPSQRSSSVPALSGGSGGDGSPIRPEIVTQDATQDLGDVTLREGGLHSEHPGRYRNDRSADLERDLLTPDTPNTPNTPASASVYSLTATEVIDAYRSRSSGYPSYNFGGSNYDSHRASGQSFNLGLPPKSPRVYDRSSGLSQAQSISNMSLLSHLSSFPDPPLSSTTTERANPMAPAAFPTIDQQQQQQQHQHQGRPFAASSTSLLVPGGEQGAAIGHSVSTIASSATAENVKEHGESMSRRLGRRDSLPSSLQQPSRDTLGTQSTSVYTFASSLRDENDEEHHHHHSGASVNEEAASEDVLGHLDIPDGGGEGARESFLDVATTPGRHVSRGFSQAQAASASATRGNNDPGKSYLNLTQSIPPTPTTASAVAMASSSSSPFRLPSGLFGRRPKNHERTHSDSSIVALARSPSILAHRRDSDSLGNADEKRHSWRG